jgi:hypothetical protein
MVNHMHEKNVPVARPAALFARLAVGMNDGRSNGIVSIRAVAIVGAVVAALVAAALLSYRYAYRPIALKGAIIQDDSDTRKESPITDVEVSAINDQAPASVKSDFSGFFRIPLRAGVKKGQKVVLKFWHADYEPLEVPVKAGEELSVIRMTPLEPDTDDESTRPQTVVSNVFVRYSIESTASVNVGAGVTTFQVINSGNAGCDHQSPCSPDNRWKAAIGSASLDAGQGNVFDDARVSCIAGPCPFTRVQTDNFSHGGRRISVSVLDWSDTTTFLFQAEVFRQEINDIVRESYPVIFGRALNFSLPAAAEGPSLEAELGGTNIVFPLGPAPELSWADCNVKVGKDQSKSYRCELKDGYKFP